MTENKDRFKIRYDNRGAKVIFDGSPLCFLNKSRNEHFNLTNKSAKFYKALKQLGQESAFSIELATELKKQMDEVFTEITKSKKPKEKEVVEPNKEIDTWDKLKDVINRNMYKRDEEFKFLIACVISLWFRQNDFIFILPVGERGTGKSTMLKAFDGSGLTHSEDTFSLNAFAPGLASVGEQRFSLLDECIDKTLIIHDMSASLSLPKEAKLKVLGEITNSYDEDGLSKFSPGAGSRKYGGAYNFIGGITYRFLRNNWSVISNTGRFLYYKLREVEFRKIIDSKLIPNKTELNAAVKGFLYNLNEQYKELTKDHKWNKIIVSQNSIEYMKDFFDVYKKYLQVVWKQDEKELQYDPLYKLENPVRRYNQALMLLKAIAFLKGRDKVLMDDFRDIRQIFWGIDNKGERKKKLKLIDEEDLPDFRNKSWNRYSLFEVASKKELERLWGLDRPDQKEPEPFDKQAIEMHESMLPERVDPTPNEEEEPPIEEPEYFPLPEEISELEKAHDRQMRRQGGDL